jgi:hypothetical protein
MSGSLGGMSGVETSVVCGLHAGRLASLAGACVPTLHAAGYWQGGLLFLLAMSRINGSHPTPGACDAGTLAAAMAVGAARELPTPMPIPICHTCSLSFWCCGVPLLLAGAACHPRKRGRARRHLRGQHPHG